MIKITHIDKNDEVYVGRKVCELLKQHYESFFQITVERDGVNLLTWKRNHKVLDEDTVKKTLEKYMNVDGMPVFEPILKQILKDLGIE